MEMFFELECPHCGHGLKIPVKYLGKRGQCVKCHGAVDTSVNMQLKGGGTLLHNAVKKGDPNLVAFLLSAGADPNAKDNAGITPLDAAKTYNIASILLEKDANEPPVLPVQVPVTTVLTEGTKKCPYCANEIRAEAVKCQHCGEFLDGRTTSITEQPLRTDGRDTGTTKKKANGCVGCFVVGLVCFFGLVLIGSLIDDTPGTAPVINHPSPTPPPATEEKSKREEEEKRQVLAEAKAFVNSGAGKKVPFDKWKILGNPRTLDCTDNRYWEAYR